MNSTATAQNIEKLPVPTLQLKGTVLPADMGCYESEGLKQLATYRHDCRSYQTEAAECEKLNASLIESTPWYESKFTWLLVGVTLGLTGALAVQAAN